MRTFKIVAIVMALFILISGSIESCAWLLIDGNLPIPPAGAALAAFGINTMLVFAVLIAVLIRPGSRPPPRRLRRRTAGAEIIPFVSRTVRRAA
jgi:hypothetical protein